MHSNYNTLYAVIPAALGGVLGLSVIINIILTIVVVILITKIRVTFPLPPTIAMVNEGEGKQGTLDIEMKCNSLYGQLTAAGGTDNIVTKPNEVYLVHKKKDTCTQLTSRSFGIIVYT